MAQIITTGEILVEIMATRIGQTFLEPALFARPFLNGTPPSSLTGRLGSGPRRH